jgi:hypothetical protein
MQRPQQPPPRPEHNAKPFTLGDGGPTEYRVRLTLNGKTVDEAEVKVSF